MRRCFGGVDQKAITMTKEQQATLDKYYGHWITLRDLQFIQNLDGKVIDDIQRVHNEILPPRLYTRWCGECVAEMVRNTYRKYDAWKAEQETKSPENPDSSNHEKKKQHVKNSSNGSRA